MSATKKDYIAIAEIINWTRENESTAKQHGSWPVREIAVRLADYFQAENRQFDRQRFLTACGISQEVRQ